jgi:hypothetical protein
MVIIFSGLGNPTYSFKNHAQTGQNAIGMTVESEE